MLRQEESRAFGGFSTLVLLVSACQQELDGGGGGRGGETESIYSGCWHHVFAKGPKRSI